MKILSIFKTYKTRNNWNNLQYIYEINTCCFHFELAGAQLSHASNFCSEYLRFFNVTPVHFSKTECLSRFPMVISNDDIYIYYIDTIYVNRALVIKIVFIVPQASASL